MEDLIKINYAGCMSEFTGENGINESEIQSMAEHVKSAYKSIKKQKENGKLGFMELPFSMISCAKDIETLKKRIISKFENFIVIGIGGSALGNIALQQALKPPFWNLLSKKERKGYLRLFVPDNVDPELISSLLDVVNLKKTLINVISKSGTTSECLSNYFVVKNKLQKKVGKKNYRDHIIITTDANKGYLREIAKKENICSFSVPSNVGGRFSVLSPVGLLSAAFTGIKINELLEGARIMAERCDTDELKKNPSAFYAVLQYLMYKKGRNINVMLPYSNALYGFADWFRQLWAESLGKKYDRSNNVVKTGITPVKALGVTDQHSQIQLYIEGPEDKFITFLSVKEFRKKIEIPKTEDKHYLGGHTLNELFKCEEDATRMALTEEKRPNCTVIFPRIDEKTVGQFIYLFELSTAYMGEFLNINAYDQPGVELGKQLTYALLGRPGYESKKEEIISKVKSASLDKYIV